MLYKITALIACNIAFAEGIQIESTWYDDKADLDFWNRIERKWPGMQITNRAEMAIDDVQAGYDTWATFKLINSRWGPETKIELESWSWSPDTDENYKQFLKAVPDTLPRFAYYRTESSSGVFDNFFIVYAPP